ncbi:MAG: hypothetical protein IJX16_01080 [Clostridia bacterium]|nr:hypothetical protein [Clostridia bacterium]
MLKKTAVLLCAVIFTLFISYSNEKPLFNNYSDSFEVYTESASSNAVIVNATRYSYPLISAKVGESCKIVGQFDLTTFLEEMGASMVFTEQTEQGVSYYAYSRRIRYNAFINGSDVNLHVFIGKSGVTVGSPLIFGSF